MIKLESCNPSGGELNVARLVSSTLIELGRDNKLDEFQLGRANVIGTILGGGKMNPLIFSFYLVTLPIGHEAWDFPPFEAQESNGKLYGRGASDMKSAVVAFIGVANIIIQWNLLLLGQNNCRGTII